jgi:hypothetical protein
MTVSVDVVTDRERLPETSRVNPSDSIARKPHLGALEHYMRIGSQRPQHLRQTGSISAALDGTPEPEKLACKRRLVGWREFDTG